MGKGTHIDAKNTADTKPPTLYELLIYEGPFKS